MADRVDLMMELARRKLATEMPEESKATASVTHMNGPDPGLMFTDTTNHIQYNRDRLKKFTQPDMEDVLAHELTHVRQNMRHPFSAGDYMKFLIAPITGGSTPYAQDPAELEAWQTMKDRAASQHRNMNVWQPPFLGGTALQTNVQLPKERK